MCRKISQLIGRSICRQGRCDGGCGVDEESDNDDDGDDVCGVDEESDNDDDGDDGC